jgi:hypothetical protein
MLENVIDNDIQLILSLIESDNKYNEENNILPKEDIIEEKQNEIQTTEDTESIELYFVRKMWEDIDSQIGAYTILDNAIIACDNAEGAYEVYNSNGEVLYPSQESDLVSSEIFKCGDLV